MKISKNTLKCLKNDISSIKLLKEDVIKSLIQYADKEYYTKKESVFTDEEYEYMKEYILSIDPDFEKNVGHKAVPVDKTAVKLPVWMGSMDKKHDAKSQNNVVLTDKLDGVSCLLVNKNKTLELFTRGNGSHGQNITHLSNTLNLVKEPIAIDIMVRGELIMKKDVFKKIKDKESNARNTVSGYVNSKKPNPKYKNKIDFIAYEVIEPKNLTPVEQFQLLKKNNFFNVNNSFYEEISGENIHNTLIDRKNNSDYEIDGIIVTQNIKYNIPTSGNPKHAFAYKHNFDENAVETKVIKVIWNISPNGYYKPTVEFEKVCINDVCIQKATAHNAKYISDKKIGPGSIIKIQRSGDVIPYIVDVIKSTKPQMPEEEYIWSNSGIDIKTQNENDDGYKKRVFVNMLTTLKFDNLGQKSIEKIYDSNIRTIKQFYNLSVQDILQLEGYKQKSSEKLFNSINSRKETITCLEYMVASKCFDEGLGMKTLKKIIEVYGEDDVPLQKLIDLEDVGESRAKSYKSGLGKFKKFIESNGLTCKKTEAKVVNNDKGKFKNQFVVFSGFRDEKLQNMIELEGGTIQNTINSKTTLLVLKKESASSKVKQAKEMNIEIMTKDQFELKYKI